MMELWEIFFESFDGNVDINWQKTSKGESGLFYLDGREYQIDLILTKIAHVQAKRVAEVLFGPTGKQGDTAFSSTGDAAHQGQFIYGTVGNAVADKFSEYDAFYLTAEARHSKTPRQYASKARIYKIIAERLSRRTGGVLYTINQSSRTEYLISKIRPDPQSPFYDVREKLNGEVKKAQGDTPIPDVRQSKS